MKSTLSTRILFGETVDISSAVDTLVSIQDYAMHMYEEEGIETKTAHEFSKNLIFSKSFDILGGKTIAQWITKGGSEKKAIEVIKNLISEAIKESHKQEEQKVIMAKVFTK